MKRASMRTVVMVCVLLAAGSLAQQAGNGPPEYPWAYMQGKGGTNEQFLKKLAEAQQGEGSGLVVYGDSILQSLRFEDGPSIGAIEVGNRRFGKYNPLYFAVGGESPAGLMGRLLDGVVPTGLGKNGDTAVLVNIGHNGLTGLGNGPNMTADRVEAILRHIADADPSNQVIGMALLPATGSDFQYKKGQLYPAQQVVNKRIEELAKTHPNIHYADCTEAYFLDPKNPVMSNPELQPDGVHLSPKGFEAIADCIDPLLTEITSSKSSSGSTYKPAATLYPTTANTTAGSTNSTSAYSSIGASSTAGATASGNTTATSNTSGAPSSSSEGSSSEGSSSGTSSSETSSSVNWAPPAPAWTPPATTQDAPVTTTATAAASSAASAAAAVANTTWNATMAATNSTAASNSSKPVVTFSNLMSFLQMLNSTQSQGIAGRRLL